MNYKEALAWLRGERSGINYLPVTEDRQSVTAIYDAAMTQQAYWIVRAHNEGLVTESLHKTYWACERHIVFMETCIDCVQGGY